MKVRALKRLTLSLFLRSVQTHVKDVTGNLKIGSQQNFIKKEVEYKSFLINKRLINGMLQVHETDFYKNVNVTYSLVKAPVRVFIEFDKVTLKFKTRAGTTWGR